MPYALRAVPERIVCLTEEPTEILCLLGLEDRIVGVSAYSVRPAGIRKRKPVVSAFLDGSVEKILALEPDLIIGFSDIQADLAAKLIRHNLQVLIFNQRSVQEILDVVLCIGRLIGAEQSAEALVRDWVRQLHSLEEQLPQRTHHPRVYFEEWPDPMISGIRWVSELIELAGGHDIFAERSHGKLAKERFVTPEEVIDAAPEVVLASWCGKPFDRESFVARPGFGDIPAVSAGRVHELDSSIILQPGPACLTDGLAVLNSLIGGDAVVDSIL